MQLLPTKVQWNRWSLPSKLTAIGTILGLLSIILAAGFFLIDQLDQGEVGLIGRKLDEYHTQVLQLQPSLREYAYSLAMIRAIADFAESQELHIESITRTDGEKISSVKTFTHSETTYGERVGVKVNSKLFEKSDGNHLEMLFRREIELTFLKSVANSKIPRKLTLVMESTKDGTEFSDAKSGPSLGSFSPMELLIEFNIAGFFISSAREISESVLLLQVKHQNLDFQQDVYIELGHSTTF